MVADFRPLAGVGWVCNSMRLVARQCVMRMWETPVNIGDFAVVRFDAARCGTLKLALKATRITGPYSPPLQKYVRRRRLAPPPNFWQARAKSRIVLCRLRQKIMAGLSRPFNSRRRISGLGTGGGEFLAGEIEEL